MQVTPLRRTLASSPKSECVSCRQQGHTGSKTVLQRNPPVLNCGCRLTQVVLYNGHKAVIGVVVSRSTCFYIVKRICNGQIDEVVTSEAITATQIMDHSSHHQALLPPSPCELSINSHFLDEPGLISSLLVFFLHFYRKRTFEDNRHRFVYRLDVYPSRCLHTMLSSI